MENELENEFEMTDLGEMKYFLGMEIHQSNGGIFISQKKYDLEILKKFHMEKCKPVATLSVVNEKLSRIDGDSRVDASIYSSLVRGLLYFSAIRLDIRFLQVSCPDLCNILLKLILVQQNAYSDILRVLLIKPCGF